MKLSSKSAQISLYIPMYIHVNVNKKVRSGDKQEQITNEGVFFSILSVAWCSISTDRSNEDASIKKRLLQDAIWA